MTNWERFQRTEQFVLHPIVYIRFTEAKWPGARRLLSTRPPSLLPPPRVGIRETEGLKSTGTEAALSPPGEAGGGLSALSMTGLLFLGQQMWPEQIFPSGSSHRTKSHPVTHPWFLILMGFYKAPFWEIISKLIYEKNCLAFCNLISLSLLKDGKSHSISDLGIAAW